MHKIPESVTPAPLKRGDSIGIIAPAGPINDRAAFEKGLKLISEMGFRPHHLPDIFRRNGYLAGSDQERLAELHELWGNPEVKAIVAARGGYGSLRLLAGLDLALIRRQPKMLIGFSDLTFLLSAIQKQSGLITFHGPMLCTLARSHPDSQKSFFQRLTDRAKTSLKAKGLEILRGGRASGHLLPGNLTSLVHLLDTPWEPHWQGAIAVLEDTGEAPYRLDRLLTQLWASGRLKKIAGLVLGDFGGNDAAEAIWQRAMELTPIDVPIWAGFPCGHGAHNLTLPCGAEADLDSSTGILSF